MRTVAIVALVLVIVLTGLPLGMTMGTCPPTCHGTDARNNGTALGLCSAVGNCLAVFSMFTLILAFMLGLAKATQRRALSLLLVRSLDHPPRG